MNKAQLYDIDKIRNTIICGDCLEELQKIPSESIDCVVTSPPYWGLRSYGDETVKIWNGDPKCEHDFEDSFCNKCGAWQGQLGHEPTIELYVNHLCDIFDEVRRILKKEGTCWVVIGDTYLGSNCGKGDRRNTQNLSKTKAQKDIYNKSNPSNNYKLQAKCLALIPARFAIEMINRNWILRNKIIWRKPNALPQSAKDRFTVDYEEVFFFVKNKKYYFEQQLEPYHPDTDVWYRKQLRREKEYNVKTPYKDNVPYTNTRVDETNDYSLLGKNKRCVWDINTQPLKEAHFAPFPPKLIEPMIEAGCPTSICSECGEPIRKILDTKTVSIDYTSCDCSNSDGAHVDFVNGIVLDPFIGSGTTAIVAKQLGRDYIGIELNPEYVEIANNRIKNIQESLPLL